ncbi:MAG: AAA family ATPase [Chloroflexi bacterium]|nr:AAA family ATPase [Chloroflexota bacterium]
MRAVADALDLDSNAWVRWQKAGRSGGDAFRVWLDLELTGEWERELLRAFLCAAVCDQQAFQQLQYPQTGASDAFRDAQPARWVEYVRHGLGPGDVSWLCHGRLVVEYEHDTCRAWYQSLPDQHDQRLRWQWWLAGLGSSGLSAAEDPRGSTSLLAAVVNNPAEEQRAALLEYLRGSTASPPPLDLPGILERISPQAISLEVRRLQGDWPDAAHREFERRAGVRLESSRVYDGRFVFERLLRSALVFTENIRRAPRLTFPPDRWQTSAPVELSDGENLALFLFRLKNGDRADWDRYAAVQKLFRQLTGNGFHFDVGFGALTDGRTGPAAAHRQSPDSQMVLELRVGRDGDGYEVPLELAGAGIAEALFLSAIIAGTRDQVVLLDEPAQNLHPAAQANLLRAIDDALQAQQNQFFVITHSPSLVPTESIEKVSRFALERGETRRWALADGSPDQERLNKLQKVLRGSMDARALLFSSAVILMEGETELGALPVWDEKAFEQPFERSNVAILSVDGDQAFETYLRFVHAFGIRWAIVCDGKVVGPHPNVRRNIAQQLVEAGVADRTDFIQYDQLDFHQRRELLAKHGVFTVASSPNDEFEALPIIQQMENEAEKAVGSSKVRKGRYIAEKAACPQEVRTLLRRLREYLGVESTPQAQASQAPDGERVSGPAEGTTRMRGVGNNLGVATGRGDAREQYS